MNIGPDVASTQQALLAQVGTQVLAMSIRDARDTAQRFQHLMETADQVVQVVRDASAGQAVNILG